MTVETAAESPTGAGKSVMEEHKEDNVSSAEDRPTKRARIVTSTRVSRHPLGVRPEGNALGLANAGKLRVQALGPLFGRLTDELLVAILQELENPRDLLRVGHTCKAMYAFSWFDELWKRKLHESGRTPATWRGSWRLTFWDVADPNEEALADVSGLVYSDFLYRPFQCVQIDYASMVGVKRTADAGLTELPGSNIPKFKAGELTAAQFEAEWHTKPFVVNMDRRIAEWSIDDLVNKYGNMVFRQEYMEWPLRVYREYMRSNLDEQPLYLFDCKSEAHRDLEYETPLADVFGKDYFELLGKLRPDHRWLIVGPERSGSTFHKDPNGTSAWNSIVSGYKYWVMFPPHVAPPGVSTDSAQSEVTAPVSVGEWFLSGFYAEARSHPAFRHAICGPSQTMYVPSGWWHLVVNLTDAVALTGNFLPRPQLGYVMDFLKNKPDQISGFCDSDVDVYDAFTRCLRDHDSDAYTAGLAGQRAIESARAAKWSRVTAEKTAFSFNFGGDDDDDDESSD